jgi:hypothetical protein
MKIGSLGFTYPETSTAGDNPNSPRVETNACPSYMVIRNTYTGFPVTELHALQITVAHEFYHTIQNGYDAWEKRWLKEATAMWCEDEVFDDVNYNYQYLSPWFAYPSIPLDADNTADVGITYPDHWYGSWIFFRYISEHIGGRNTVRGIWEESANYNSRNGDFSFNAIEDAFRRQNTTFEAVFRDFTVANLMRTIPPYAYEEGAQYPEIAIEALLFGDRTIELQLRRRASHYIRISPNVVSRDSDIINITFTPLDTNTRFAVQVVTRSGNTVQVYPFASNYALRATRNMDEIVVIVMNVGNVGTTNNFRLRVQTSSPLYRITFGSKGTWTGDIQLRNGRITWTTGLGKAYIFDGTKVFELPPTYYTHDGRTAERQAALHVSLSEHVAAWVDTAGWQIPFFWITNCIRYYDFEWKTDEIIASAQWSVVGEPLTFGKQILFGIRYFQEPGQLKVDDTRALAISDDGADPKPITTLYRLDDGVLEAYQINGDQVIWAWNDTVYWFNGLSNVFPPTRFRNTVPYLDRGQLVWAESKSDENIPGTECMPVTPSEIFFFDRTQVRQLTDDTTGDCEPVISAGQIAWAKVSPIGGSQYHVAFFDGKKTILLVDSLTGLPEVGGSYGSYIRIDSGLVAWIGRDFSVFPGAYLYDGISIKRITPPDLDVMGLDIHRGQIAIAARNRKLEDEIYLYVHTRDTTPTYVVEKRSELPEQFTLFPNYPNPFNPITTISYNLPVASRVKLNIFNLLGQEIRTLVNQIQEPGYKSVTWDGLDNGGRSMIPGVYFYRLEAVSITDPMVLFIEVKNMLLLR